MTEAAVIYEVTLEVEPSIVGAFDAWLAGHMQAMLQLPGFRDARQLPALGAAAQPDAWVTRVVQYTLASQADLDRYLREHAPRMRASGTEHFGDRFRASRRILNADGSELIVPPPASALCCLNCGTLLIGKYCVECGQPNHTYVAPLWETIEEFFGNHFGLDTKFFHSIVPLLFQPGFLTREYCAGRRERYIKPLRLYLFCSILFFFCAAWLMPSHFGDSDIKTPATLSATQRAKLRKQLQDSITEIRNDPNLSADQKTRITAQQQRLLDATQFAQLKSTLDAVSTGQPQDKSGAKNSKLPAVLPEPGAGEKDATFSERFREKVAKIKADQSRFVNELLYHAVPKAMFVFLPLVALLLKLFYIRRKHLYMEHLIFTLHYHALFFAALLTGIVISTLATHYAWPAAIKDWTVEIIKWYLIAYLFLALRNFYQQSWLKTLAKFCLMSIGYFILAGLGFVGAVLVAIMEV